MAVLSSCQSAEAPRTQANTFTQQLVPSLSLALLFQCVAVRKGGISSDRYTWWQSPSGFGHLLFCACRETDGGQLYIELSLLTFTCVHACGQVNMLVCEYVEARDLCQVSSSIALLLPLFFLLLLFSFFLFLAKSYCVSL